MSNRIPLSSPDVTEAECDAVRDVILSKWLTHGPKNRQLEDEFRDYLGVAGAVCLNSCFSALYLAIKASRITGEVILPSLTHVASANAIVTAGATPVFADIGYETCNLDPGSLQRCLTDRTEAIMVVHYAGQACDMDRITEIAQERNLTLIEDSAETVGGTYKDRQAGSFGIGCFSFFPTKSITTGEGGLITSQDEAFIERARALAGHGIHSSTWDRSMGKAQRAPWYREAAEYGFNFRMSNIQGAIGVVQLKKLDRMNGLRRAHAQYLIEGLKDEERIDLPFESPDCKHVYQMFTIKLKDTNRDARDAFIWKLRDRNIEASVHFDPPLHQQEIYSEFRRDDLRVTDRVSQCIVTLPLFPGMSREMLDRVIDAVRSTVTELASRQF